MAGGGVSRNIYGVFKDGFEIEMNFDRNVSCLIAVYALMDNDFFNKVAASSSVMSAYS